MIEPIAFGVICFILTPNGFFRRLKKGVGGTILYTVLIQSYTVLQPLLPTEIDELLHSTIWGVLFAYAVPEKIKGNDKGKKDNHEKDNENRQIEGDKDEREKVGG
jgi:hypothetical protein